MKKVLYRAAQKTLAIVLLAITAFYAYIAQEAGVLFVVIPISMALFLSKENMFEEMEKNRPTNTRKTQVKPENNLGGKNYGNHKCNRSLNTLS